MKRSIVAALCALLVAGVVPAGAQDTTYGPSQYGPFERAGDQFNFFHNDASTGTIGILRAYPVPGAVNCGGSGGRGYYTVQHTVASSAPTVTVAYRDAAIDTYTWLAVAVSTPTRPYAHANVRGPLAGDGSLTVPVADAQGLTPPVGSTITIRFGVEIASACPNVDGGIARFASVAVSD